MAIVITNLWTTQYAVGYSCVEGAAGPSTANLDASGAPGADLVTNTVAGTPIRDLVSGDLSLGTATYLNQAATRAALGMNTATVAQLRGKVSITPTTVGQTSQWSVDADVVAAPGAMRLTVGSAGASSAVLIIRRRHSVGR
jgi:hypothetical protein